MFQQRNAILKILRTVGNEQVAEGADVGDYEVGGVRLGPVRLIGFSFGSLGGGVAFHRAEAGCLVGRDLAGGLERGFAGEYEDSDGSGVVCHCRVGVNPVSCHDYFIRFEIVPLHYSLEHIRVRLAEGYIWAASGSVFYAGAERTAVNEDRRKVGRADTVGIGGDVGESL